VEDVVAVTNFFEGMGIYAKHGFAEQNVIFDFWSQIITSSWQRLAPAVAVMRRTSGPSLYENFQYLAILAQRFIDVHPEGSAPKAVRLSPIEDPWLKHDHPA
jgi:hypothetical protein